jgi:predicted RNase H-like HicB family nuclease
MPETSSIHINLIQPQFFFESHTAAFVEPSASEAYASLVFVTPDIARVRLASLEILITELESGYTARQAIPAKIEKTGGSYMASFEEANIHASGETWSDAARNLKTLILDIYDSLISETAKLGPGPKRQLATLLRYVKAE